MSTYITKTWLEKEFDKVVKEFSGKEEVEENEPSGLSGEELVAEEKRRAAEEQERKARQAKVAKEREEARQKIRDKYNIPKKDDSPRTSQKQQQHGKVDNPVAPVDNANLNLEKVNESEPQSFQPMKMTMNAFNNVKRKFGWK